MNMKIIIVCVLLMINIFGYLLMYIDKQRSIKGKYRIKEKTLWNVTFCFGAIGTTLGMRMFRHKTKHSSFKYGFPILAVIQIVIIGYLLLKVDIDFYLGQIV